LFEIITATHPPGGLSRSLNGGKKQTDENPNDCDDNEKLHQREGGTGFRKSYHLSYSKKENTIKNTASLRHKVYFPNVFLVLQINFLFCE
jgi:hypothetical protein